MSEPTNTTALNADPIYQARDHMHAIDRLGALSPDDRIQIMAKGGSLAAMQHNELSVASAWALIACAEALQAIAKQLGAEEYQ